MGFRFRRSLKIGPGVRLDLGTKSAGFSFGTRGFHYSVNSARGARVTGSIPGTGLSYSTSLGEKHRRQAPGTAAPRQGPRVQAATPKDVLPKPGLFAAAEEKRYHEGILAFLGGDLAKAWTAFQRASERDQRNVSDDLFAALVADKLGNTTGAIAHLEVVVSSHVSLPDELQRKYLPAGKVDLVLTVSITPHVRANLDFDSLGAAMMLAEHYQAEGRLEEAIGLIQQLVEEQPGNAALRLSLCDLLFEDGDDPAVVHYAANAENDSTIGLACLYLRAQALARQDLRAAAIDTYAACLKRTAGRDPDLLTEIRYERACFLETVGQNARARAEFERLYASSPSYRDLARRVAATV